MKNNKYNKRWHPKEMLFNSTVPVAAASWLFNPSSLTKRLLLRCPKKFSVKLISQSVKRPSLDEARALKIRMGRSALIREVLLYCGDEPVVYARTVIPLNTLSGAQNSYSNLGNRPLGAMLFSDRTMRRDKVEITTMSPDKLLTIKAGSLDEVIWGRRSVFHVGGKPLLVCEFFLPAIYQ